MAEPRFNLLFTRRFFGLLKLMFPRLGCVSVLLFVLLLAIVILEQFIIYQVGLIPSKYYKVLGEKDLLNFKKTTVVSFLIVVAIAFVKATEKYVSGLLHVIWRKLISKRVHHQYFKDVHYYTINVLECDVDNPDQRITQDVDRMCLTLSEIIAKLLITPFTMIYYFYKCWQTTGYIGPVCVVGFFMVSTIFNKFLMSPVVGKVVQQEKREGDFRFKHMQIRVNAESAAFFRAGENELIRTNEKLSKLISIQLKLVLFEYPLNFAISMADYVGSILSYIIVAIPIFSGMYDDKSSTDLSGIISANSFVMMYLINCFTSLIDMAIKATDIAGYTHRIGELQERLKKLDEKAEQEPQLLSNEHQSPSYDTHVNVDSTKTAFTLDNVTYGPPGQATPLVKELSMQIVSGVNTLINGDSGCGKSSLLRVIDGLWHVKNGRILKRVPNGPSGMVFLPQKPYFTDGTLREQIIYPYTTVVQSTVYDNKIKEFMREVDLESLIDRVGSLDTAVGWNWFDVLSPGEMQRLSFVRLFFHQPQFAVLDEATSQVGVQMENKLYTMCRMLGITVISVGHRDSLRQYHNMVLQLDGAGGWKLQTIS